MAQSAREMCVLNAFAFSIAFESLLLNQRMSLSLSMAMAIGCCYF